MATGVQQMDGRVKLTDFLIDKERDWFGRRLHEEMHCTSKSAVQCSTVQCILQCTADIYVDHLYMHIYIYISVDQSRSQQMTKDHSDPP